MFRHVLFFFFWGGALPTRLKGTRLDDEKEFYETYFGGGTRAQNILISPSNGGKNAATPQGLQAMQEVGCCLPCCAS